MIYSTIAFVLVYVIKYSRAVEIAPDTDTTGLGISVDLTSDPRGINKINAANQWKLDQDVDDPLYDWGLILTLDAQEYSFRETDGSMISISIDGFCSTDECDGYFAFSIGDQQYATFVTDFDGKYDVNLDDGDARNGIFIYPTCGSNAIEYGDPSNLIPSASSGDFTRSGIRDALSGGNDDEFGLLSSTQNGENFPITFELINNAISNTFTFRFSSPTFTTPLGCNFDSSVLTGKDLKLYITPDVGAEILKIKTFEINGINTGFTPQPTSSPTLDGCDFDIDSYLEQCYCSSYNDISGAQTIGFGRNQHQNRYGYNDYRYYDGMNNNVSNNNNNNFIQYLNLLLTTILFVYILYIHSNCCSVKRNRNRYNKVDIYSGHESERNQINA